MAMRAYACMRMGAGRGRAHYCLASAIELGRARARA